MFKTFGWFNQTCRVIKIKYQMPDITVNHYCILTIGVEKIMSNICPLNWLCLDIFTTSVFSVSEIAPMMAKTIKAFKNRFSRR